MSPSRVFSNFYRSKPMLSHKNLLPWKYFSWEWRYFRLFQSILNSCWLFTTAIIKIYPTMQMKFVKNWHFFVCIRYNAYFYFFHSKTLLKLVFEMCKFFNEWPKIFYLRVLLFLNKRHIVIRWHCWIVYSQKSVWKGNWPCDSKYMQAC